MKITAVISEFDPFHNGHKYLLDETRRRTDNGGVVCIMSGSFPQRGRPAICDKWSRAEMALRSGADVVIELPFVYAVSSAQFFALGGVSAAKVIGADGLAFGIESTESNVLKAAERRVSGEYREKLLEGIRNGSSYAAAAGAAIGEERTRPNDILACEYIAAMDALDYSPELLMIPRAGAGHDSEEPSDGFASASAIRKLFLSGEIDAASEYMPAETVKILQNWLKTEKFVTSDDFSAALCVKLRTMPPDLVEMLPFGGGGLDRLVYNNAQKYSSWEKIVSASTSLRYPSSRVSRFMVWTLTCDMLKSSMFSPDELDRIYSEGELPYIRVLGIRRGRGEEILSEIARRCGERAKIVTAPFKYLDNTVTADNASAHDLLGYKMLMTDITAQAVYDSVLRSESLSDAHRDLSRKFLTVTCKDTVS